MVNLVLMILFYSTDIAGQNITLTEDDHIHCTKVLRKQVNDIIMITDGLGHIFSCAIKTITKVSTLCQVVEKSYHQSILPKTSIAISPTKNAARIEWFIEKAVEIGISEIYFYNAQRTEKKSINEQRLKKIMVSAMKQSLNVQLPVMHITKDVKAYVDLVTSKYDQKFIAYCDGPTQHLTSAQDNQKSRILMIGPEGDFTAEEIRYATNAGYQSVTLGTARLRTETAGLAGLIMMRSSC